MAFEKVQIKTELANTPESNIDFSKLFKDATIDLNKTYARPPLAISIGNTHYGSEVYPQRFGTYGNFSVIMGEEKSRKTFFKSMLLACAIGGNAYAYNDKIKGHGLEDKLIIDIDTEQDLYDNFITAKRIPQMVGSLPKNYISLNLRGKTPNEIKESLKWLFLESEYKNNLGIVSIDGYVDCINDFNSQVESKEFVTDLMHYSKTANCHITGVLHLNPGSDKGRGHFGTMVAQKSEMVVIAKCKGDHSEIVCKRVRGGRKFDPFCIRVGDKDWLPYVSEDPIEIDWTKK